MLCHPLSVMENIMEKQTCSTPNGRSIIPDLWDMNLHFPKIQGGEIKWQHVFQFDEYMEGKRRKQEAQITTREKI